jgi:phage terminase large subunit-like protein
MVRHRGLSLEARILSSLTLRHCEDPGLDPGDVAIQRASEVVLDCFALLAMTGENAPRHFPPRILIGLDPPASTHGDSCGIIVCAKDEEGVAWVLADLTAHGLSPEAWAARVAETAALYGAGLIVAEKNNGGEMIAAVLRAADFDLPVKLRHAGPSKAARAEPIALHFETGRARLAGHFPELEDQLCALTWSGYQGPGSPDRADAMVWAMTELFEKERAEPRVRRL